MREQSFLTIVGVSVPLTGFSRLVPRYFGGRSFVNVRSQRSLPHMLFFGRAVSQRANSERTYIKQFFVTRKNDDYEDLP